MKSPTGILVQMRGDGTLGREEKLMSVLAEARGIELFKASEKQVERSKVRLTNDMVAVGSVPFVKHALRQLGKKLPEHIPYPSSLEALLHRKVSRLSTLREAKAHLNQGRRLFIKPADGWKRFTGFVAEFSDDYRFSGASMSKPVWVSEPVQILSEWRTYVANGQLLETRFADYGGDRTKEPNYEVIASAIQTLSTTGSAPAGFVIDFGVLKNGETALIEMNDGFSFGSYDGLSPETYWQVTVSRWMELVEENSLVLN